jgi:hypothetical protein
MSARDELMDEILYDTCCDLRGDEELAQREANEVIDAYRDEVREAAIQYARGVINRMLKGPTYDLHTLDAVDVQLAALADDASQPGVWAG